MMKKNKRQLQSIRPTEELYAKALVAQMAQKGRHHHQKDSHNGAGTADSGGWKPIRRLQGDHERDADNGRLSSADADHSHSDTDSEIEVEEEEEGIEMSHGGSSVRSVRSSESGKASASDKNKILKRDRDGRISVSMTLSGMGKAVIHKIAPARAKVRFHKVEKEKMPFFVPVLYQFEEEEDLFSDGGNVDKHYYSLSLLQRIFIMLDHPSSCKLASAANWTVMLVTLLSVGIYIVSTLPEVNSVPSSCESPACSDDPTLCPGVDICTPESPVSFTVVETMCLYVFVADYFMRFALAFVVPPRLAGVSPSWILPLPKYLNSSKKSGADGGNDDDNLLNNGGDGDSQTPGSIGRNNNNKSGSGKDMDVSTSSNTSSPNRWNADSFIATPSTAARYTPARNLDDVDSDGESDPSPIGSSKAMTVHQQQSGDGNTLTGSTNAYTTGDNSPNPDEVQLPANVASLASSLDDQRARNRRAMITRSGSIKPKHIIEMKNSSGALKEKPDQHLFIDKSLANELETRSQSFCSGDIHSSFLAAVWAGVQQTTLYMTQWMNIVDFVAILPFFLAFSGDEANGSTLSIVRVLRLARILRVLKLGKGSKGLQVLLATMMSSLPALVILGFFSVIGFILLGSLEYFFEGGSFKVTDDYPDGTWFVDDIKGEGEMQSKYTSIPMSMYWSIITSTGVGFGDIYPVSYMGRFIAVVAMYGGILVLALPISVIGNNFERIYDQSKGHLSYGVVNAILELMEDDSEDTPTPESLQHDAELLGEEGTTEIGIFRSRRMLLEKRASKLASVFVIAQVCLKENEADDINLLLIKVGLRDMIAALEYVYDLDFRQQQLEDFVLQAVSEKLNRGHKYDALDDGHGDNSPWQRASVTEGDGTWSPTLGDSADSGDSDSPSRKTMPPQRLEGYLHGTGAGDKHDSTMPRRDSNQFRGEADVDKGTFHFSNTANAEMNNDHMDNFTIGAKGSTKFGGSHTIMSMESMSGKRSSIRDITTVGKSGGGKPIGKRLPIGEYHFGAGQTEVDFEQVESEEFSFYESEYASLSSRTKELLRYLRKSPDYMEVGFLREIYDAAYKAASEGTKLRSSDIKAIHAKVAHTIKHFKTHSDIKSHINMAKRRVSVAYQRVEMAMHDLEMESQLLPRSPGRKNMTTRVPFTARTPAAGGGGTGRSDIDGISPLSAMSFAHDTPYGGVDVTLGSPGSIESQSTAAHTLLTSASGYTHLPTGNTPLPNDTGSPKRLPLPHLTPPPAPAIGSKSSNEDDDAGAAGVTEEDIKSSDDEALA